MFTFFIYLKFFISFFFIIQYEFNILLYFETLSVVNFTIPRSSFMWIFVIFSSIIAYWSFDVCWSSSFISEILVLLIKSLYLLSFYFVMGSNNFSLFNESTFWEFFKTFSCLITTAFFNCIFSTTLFLYLFFLFIILWKDKKNFLFYIIKHIFYAIGNTCNFFLYLWKNFLHTFLHSSKSVNIILQFTYYVNRLSFT